MIKKDDEAKQQFFIQRFYVKDLSFESPRSPEIFAKEWKPDMQLDLHTDHATLEDDSYEVILTLTITVKSHGKVAFLIEVKQAGVFTILGFGKKELEHALGSFCPATLYPYAREVVTDVVMKGGFPQLILAPVNFEAIYTSKQEKEKLN